MIKIVASALCAILSFSAAHAQNTQSALQAQITNTLPDNATGAITPLVMRNMFNAMVLSTSCATQSQIIYWNASLLPTCSGAPSLTTSLTVPLIIGGTTGTSTLTLQDSTNGVVTTSGFKFQSAGGLTANPTTNAGSSGNNPWEFKTGTLNIATTGKWFWTTGTPNAAVDSLYNCTTPLTIPSQPLTADTVFNFCGTFTNVTGSPQFTNMLSATCYVDGSQLDVNCASFTTVGRVAGTGGAGLIGVGKAMVQTAIAHGIELEANCHSNATNCDQARAAMFLVGGGNGGLANLAFQSWRSGAAANSVRHGIYLGDGAAINPFQDTGSAVMDSAGTHVRFDYGIDFRSTTVNTCAFASPGGFCVSGAGRIGTGNTAAADTFLTVNANSGATVAPIAGTSFHVIGADATLNASTFDSFAQVSALVGRRSNGTRAAKTTVSNNDTLWTIVADGYDGTAYSSGGQAAVNFSASQNWAVGAHGTYMDFFVTASGATALTNLLRLQQSGGLSLGSGNVGTDPGASVGLASSWQTTAVAVAGLPTCNAAAKGQRRFVTDSNATTFHNTVAAGGANNVGVTCDGTNWYIS